MTDQSVQPADHKATDEIVNTRLFNAPRETVFQAFINPAQLAKWWGPRGFTNTFHEFAPRPGGVWRFTMHGPDGASYPMTKQFTEVSPERIAMRHEQDTHSHWLTMEFADEAGGTRVTWRMRFDSPEEAEKVRSFVLQANEENFDRLEEWLATPA